MLIYADCHDSTPGGRAIQRREIGGSLREAAHATCRQVLQPVVSMSDTAEPGPPPVGWNFTLS